MNKYTKQEITDMADRCYHRCWHCERYEPCGGYGSGDGPLLFAHSSSGCYEAHSLPWGNGKWCPFWGNKEHPDEKILRSLTWNDVAEYIIAKHLSEPYDLRQKILAANPEIAAEVQYVDNSNESRDQYFNKSENHALLEFDDFNVYCETLRRYRFSHVDNKLLYPGANEWIRPMMICYDSNTYKSLAQFVGYGDGIQISFACSPQNNYVLSKEIFRFEPDTNDVIAEFKNRDAIVETYRMSLANIKSR